MTSSITLRFTPTYTSIRSFTSCTFSGRLDALDFVINWIEVGAVRQPEIWKFIQVAYYRTFGLEAAINKQNVRLVEKEFIQNDNVISHHI